MRREAAARLAYNRPATPAGRGEVLRIKGQDGYDGRAQSVLDLADDLVGAG